MKTDIEIAQEAKMKPITQIAAQLGLEDESVIPYGRYKAKIDHRLIHNAKKQGKLILVTAISPTPAGDDNDLHTTVRLRLLYLDEEETPTVTERTAEVALPAVSRDAACALLGAPEVTFNGSGCDIRQTVSLRVPETGGQTLPTVTSVELLTDRQPGRRPSLVMRRLAEGESLWDVAKQYHTDEELIRTVNHLEGESRPEKMLLIPRIR